jgi:hypothetical protein
MTEQIEIWKTIEGYETYSVSTFGNVRNDARGKMMSKHSDKNGYLISSLGKNGIFKNFKNHRLVALAFISNLENKPLIDHHDNDTTNNHIENLRWCTNKENQRNRKNSSSNTSGFKGVYFHKGRQKWVGAIQIDNKTISLGYFDTIEEATLARQTRANQEFGTFTNSCERI